MCAVVRHAVSGDSRVRRRGVLVFLWLALALPWAAGPSLAAEPGAAATAAADIREQRVSKRVVSGDTLPRLLTDLGVSPAIKNRWLRAVAKQFGVANVLRAGDTIRFYFIGPWNSWGPGEMTALRIERAGAKPLTWQLRHDHVVYHRERGLRPMTSVAERVEPSAEAAQRVANTPPKTVTEPEAATEPKVATEPPAKAVAEATAASPPHVDRVTHVLRKGETLARVLLAKGVSATTAHPWIQAAGKRYSLKRLYPGRKIVLYFVTASSQGPGQRTLRALQIESRGGDLLTWQWSDGRIIYRGRNHQVVVSEVATVPAPATVKIPAAVGPSTPTLAPTRSFEPLEKVMRTVRRGHTLGRILRPLGVTGKEGVAWFDAIDKQYPVTSLRPGQRLHLYFEKTPARHRRNNLKAVELEVKKGRKLAWERLGGKVRFHGGGLPGKGRTTHYVAAPSNGASPDTQRGSFLSEYALARIKQRNGLLEHTPAPNGTRNGTRPVPSLENADRVTHRLKSGEHLWGVLRKYESDDAERRRWLAVLQRYKYVRRLRPGSNINFYFEAPANGNGEAPANDNGEAHSNEAGNLQALEIVLRSDLRLTWYRSQKDILFYKDEVPYQQEVRTVSGVINGGSLYDNARSAGVDPAVISRMVDVLAWDINFQKDLRVGDTYRVLYRRKFRPGSRTSDRIRILAVEFVNQGRKYTAVYFEGEDGNGSYYDTRGSSVSRSFLRYPVEFRRISSRFSHSRFHPVLKVRRPHYGVDFAARPGTPIRAVGDGRVTRAGWKGGSGRLVEISHGGAMKTRYAHLRRYGPGIRRGVSVKKGQTIGYVGCSGLCTGPHLHFEMWQDNRYVDPLRANVPVERKLDPLLMGIFETTKKLFLERLDAGRKAAGLTAPAPS